MQTNITFIILRLFLTAQRKIQYNIQLNICMRFQSSEMLHPDHKELYNWYLK